MMMIDEHAAMLSIMSFASRCQQHAGLGAKVVMSAAAAAQSASKRA